MSKREPIDALLAKWEELRDLGQEVSASQLCLDSPELLPELQTQIDRLKAMDWLDSPLEKSLPACGGLPSNVSSESRIGDTKIPSVLGGRYEMQSLISEGGFGQVWRAQDTSLLRPVAIKITAVNCLAEARRVAQLKHQGIVTVHDVGNVDGLCYIVFDLVDGITLSERIEQMPLNWKTSAQIVAQVAESVHFAHSKGFIHRDIKPDNILLDENDIPVLADFGIAVTECELRHEAMTSVGTLAYMAPEQLQVVGLIDTRTDVYGLGVVFYQLLTGNLPFADSNLSGLREKILAGGPIPPRTFDAAIPSEYETICLKCLSIDQESRYPTAKSLAEALNAQLDIMNNRQ